MTIGFRSRLLASPSADGRLEASADVWRQGGRTGGALQVAGGSPGVGHKEPRACALPGDPDLARVGRESMKQRWTLQISSRNLWGYTEPEEAYKKLRIEIKRRLPRVPRVTRVSAEVPWNSGIKFS